MQWDDDQKVNDKNNDMTYNKVDSNDNYDHVINKNENEKAGDEIKESEGIEGIKVLDENIILEDFKSHNAKIWRDQIRASNGILPMSPNTKVKLARLVPAVVDRLSEIIHTSKNERAVLQAIEIVLNRVHGKPVQSVDIDAKVESDNTVKIELQGQLRDWSK